MRLSPSTRIGALHLVITTALVVCLLTSHVRAQVAQSDAKSTDVHRDRLFAHLIEEASQAWARREWRRVLGLYAQAENVCPGRFHDQHLLVAWAHAELGERNAGLSTVARFQQATLRSGKVEDLDSANVTTPDGQILTLRAVRDRLERLSPKPDRPVRAEFQRSDFLAWVEQSAKGDSNPADANALRAFHQELVAQQAGQAWTEHDWDAFRAREANAQSAPPCDAEAIEFLRYARGQMMAHPAELEIAAVVARHALRHGDVRIAWESQLVLESESALFSFSMFDNEAGPIWLASREAVTAAQSQLRSEGYMTSWSQSRRAAALLSAVQWLLEAPHRHSEMYSAIKYEYVSDLETVARDTGIAIASVADNVFDLAVDKLRNGDNTSVFRDHVLIELVRQRLHKDPFGTVHALAHDVSEIHLKIELLARIAPLGPLPEESLDSLFSQAIKLCDVLIDGVTSDGQVQRDIQAWRSIVISYVNIGAVEKAMAVAETFAKSYEVLELDEAVRRVLRDEIARVRTKREHNVPAIPGAPTIENERPAHRDVSAPAIDTAARKAAALQNENCIKQGELLIEIAKEELQQSRIDDARKTVASALDAALRINAGVDRNRLLGRVISTAALAGSVEIAERGFENIEPCDPMAIPRECHFELILAIAQAWANTGQIGRAECFVNAHLEPRVARVALCWVGRGMLRHHGLLAEEP